MATAEEFVSDASSEGYGLEPQYTEEEFAAMQQRDREQDARERAGRRTRDGDWCQCGNCHPHADMWVAECVCCQDSGTRDADTVKSFLKEAASRTGVANFQYKCITDHYAFEVLCLYKRHLLNAARSYRADYGQGSLRFRNENRLLRYIAYREFIRWTFGYCGKHVRKVIPACVVNAIRASFPKGDQETYEGFHYTDDFDPDLARMFL